MACAGHDELLGLSEDLLSTVTDTGSKSNTGVS